MLGREPGEALWPERFPVEALARTRAGVGEREWAALYQQRPRAGDGVLFKIEKFGTVLAAPAGGRIVRAWDLAATEQTGGRNPDWTVGLKLMRDADGRFYVLDVVRFRGSPNEVETAIVNTARQDGAAVRIGLPQDPGQAGKQQVLYLTSKLAGYRVSSSPETGSKETRAMPVASQVEVGNVALVRAAWNRPLLEELASFPAGTHDDQTDALSRAFGMLVQLHAPVLFSDAGLAQMARPGQAIV
jgi:predicted phage terminase large subunit-like protein